MAATTKTDFEAEAYSRKEIRERLEHFWEMLQQAKAGVLTTVTVRDIRRSIDLWLEEMSAEQEIRCLCGDDCKEKAHV